MRIDEDTLNVEDKNSYLRQKEELEIALRSIDILENITESIRQAGGGHDINGAAGLTVNNPGLKSGACRKNLELRF